MIQERKRILADHREMIHSAMRVDPWRSVLEILLTITASVLLVWSGVFAVQTGQWWLLPVIFVFISGLQHRLSILQHEAVHTLLFTQKGLNDLVGLYVIGASIGVLSSFSRRAHLSHHAHLGTDEDPEGPPYLTAPRTRKQFFVWSLLKVTGMESILRFLYLFKSIPLARADSATATRVSAPTVTDWGALLFVQGSLMVAFSLTVGWSYYFLLWLGPLFTTTRYLMGLRSMVEHATRDGVDGAEMRYMNTIHCNEVEGFFFGPLRFNYHAEHHLFPTVPSWRWSRLKHYLVEHPEFRSRVQVHHSYVGFLIRSLK